MATILRVWFPLALSWLLMSAEMPGVTAFIARMPQAKLQLAAFGVAVSLALAIESPIISMLTASNAMVRDVRSFQMVRRFMFMLNGLVTVGMLALSLTPLFDIIVRQLMGVPDDVAARVRPTLVVMSTWPAAIGYRRFFQGIMIRCGHTRQMSWSTMLRLAAALTMGALGLNWGRLEGAVAGGLALAVSTMAEAIAVHFWSIRAVRQMQQAVWPADQPPLTWRALLRFYLPLTWTSAVNLATTPLLNWGMARALLPVESLAVWPVISGQLFVTRSFGFSLQEVVVALLDRPGGRKKLQDFAALIGVWSLLLMILVACTPIGPWWQREVAGLPNELIDLAVPTLQLVLLLPLLATIQSWFRGVVVFGRKTGTVAWATVINLVVLSAVLIGGVNIGGVVGAFLSALALTLSQIIESLWLWHSARSARSTAAQTRAPSTPD